MEIVFVLIGGVAGAGVFYWLKRKDLACVPGLRVRQDSLMEVNEDLRVRLQGKEQKAEGLETRIVELEKAKTATQTELVEARKNMEEQKCHLADAQEELKVSFQALSGEALKSNNQAFVALARQTLNAVMEEARGDMGKKEESIKTLIKPLEDSLKRYDRQIQDIEQKRHTAYGSLEQQVQSMMAAQKDLQKETGNLVSALRKPAVKGSWGQMTLRKVVELAGMSEYCDFQEQVSVKTDEGYQRPDMIVRLPSNREIVIDSKVSTNAYLEAVEAGSEKERGVLLKQHAQQIRSHMRDLARKSYWEQFEKSPDFVIMFLPGESFLSVASEHDPHLMEEGMKNRIVIATPTTLMALLNAFAYGWRQEQITQNVLEVSRLGKELFERFRLFLKHMSKTGGSLKMAVENYNKMIGSLDQRVLPSVKKFKELGAASGDALPGLNCVEQIPVDAQNRPEAAVLPEGETDGDDEAK